MYRFSILLIAILSLTNCKKQCEGITVTCTHRIYNGYTVCNYDQSQAKWIFSGVKYSTEDLPVNECDTSKWLSDTRLFDKIWGVDHNDPTWELFIKNNPNECNCN